MKKLFNESRELKFSELLDINGGYSTKSDKPDNKERFRFIGGMAYSSLTGFIDPKPKNLPDNFSQHVPLQQQDFDKEYGFSDGELKNTKSCKTASLINAYAAEFGLDKETLDKAVAEWKEKNWIDTDGSPLDLNKMSNSLSKQMGLKEHYEIPGETVNKKWVQKTFEANSTEINNYEACIVLNRNDKLGTVHYTLLSTKRGSVDSLDPYRDAAKDYTAKTVQPLALYKNY